VKIHCDACGKLLDRKNAIEQIWDGEVFAFCSEECARSGRHLAEDPYGGEENGGVGPVTPGDIDDQPLPSKERS
jgi:hypothetical protein